MPDRPKARYQSARRAPHAVETQLERVQEDLRRLKQQFRTTQRLASLGRTAAVLAHETNNLLTPALGYATRAMEDKDPELADKALDITVRQIRLVMAMTERVLGMAADEPAVFSTVPIAEVVDEAVQCLCRDLSKDGITLTVDIPPDATVRGNAQQLQQVFFNILLNAQDALAGRTGRITVSAQRVDEERVEIRFEDTGCGIEPENLGRVFDDFFTTKNGSPNSRESGSGLGLSVCRDIIEEHRGRIDVSSQVRYGTTFTITLPTAQ